MPLEVFKQSFPAVPALKDQLERIGHSRDGGNKSPVIILATMLMRNSGEELRRIFRPMQDSGIQLMPSAVDFLAMGPQVRQDAAAALSGVALGDSILSVNESLGYGYFNAEQWIVRHNLNIQGTPIRPALIVVGANTIEQLSAERLQAMLSVAQVDMSLARFFKEEIQYLPNLLLDLLNQLGYFPAITQYALPIYTERAQFLVRKDHT